MADTTSLSSFPNEIDTFDRVSDVSEQYGTLEKTQIYKDKINKGKYAEAEQYLRDNEDLAQCAVNASMFNKHSDAIVALEERTLSDGLGFSTALSRLKNETEQSIADLENDINTLENRTNNISNSVTKIKKWHDISFEGRETGTIFNTSTILYQQSFEVTNNNSFGGYYIDNYVFIPDTDWVLQSNSWNPSHGYEKHIVSIEGVVEMKSPIRFWYPIGYNDGKISVNATFSQYPSSPYSYMINIRYSGINKENILRVRGIIKYTTAML